MHPLRCEVELPARLPRRAWFYLGLAGVLVSLSIIGDAALWARSTVAASRAVTVRRLHPRPPCVERRDPDHSLMRDSEEADAHAARLERERAAPGELHDQLMKQLEHPWAVDDDLEPGGRYSNVNDVAPDDGAPGRDEDATRRLKRVGIPVRR